MPRGNKKSSFSFEYLLTFMLALLLGALAVVLLIPQYREFRKEKQIEAERRKTLGDARRRLAESMRRNHSMRPSSNATAAERRYSLEATERVARVKFNQVSKDEIVIRFPPLEDRK